MAVLPPVDVVEELDEFLEPRRVAVAGSLPLRWTLPEQWHLTLAFLAEVPDRALDDLEVRLERAARRRTPFTLSLAGAGAFPHVAGAKVLYAAVTGEPEAAEELRRLAVGCRAAATKAGIAVDGARFTPHVTLARSRRPVSALRLAAALDTYASRSFPVEEIALVQSHLGEGPRGRPRYAVRASFSLGRP